MPAPPLAAREGGIVQGGYHAELDELVELAERGKDRIADLERREADHEQRKRPSARAAFVPVRLAVSNAERVAEETRPDPTRIEIELPGGRRVHVTAPVDRQALADVLAVLEGEPC